MDQDQKKDAQPAIEDKPSLFAVPFIRGRCSGAGGHVCEGIGLAFTSQVNSTKAAKKKKARLVCLCHWCSQGGDADVTPAQVRFCYELLRDCVSGAGRPSAAQEAEVEAGGCEINSLCFYLKYLQDECADAAEEAEFAQVSFFHRQEQEPPSKKPTSRKVVATVTGEPLIRLRTKKTVDSINEEGYQTPLKASVPKARSSSKTPETPASTSSRPSAFLDSVCLWPDWQYAFAEASKDTFHCE